VTVSASSADVGFYLVLKGQPLTQLS
jgi:hypothetical protein